MSCNKLHSNCEIKRFDATETGRTVDEAIQEILTSQSSEDFSQHIIAKITNLESLSLTQKVILLREIKQYKDPVPSFEGFNLCSICRYPYNPMRRPRCLGCHENKHDVCEPCLYDMWKVCRGIKCPFTGEDIGRIAQPAQIKNLPVKDEMIHNLDEIMEAKNKRLTQSE